MVGPSTSKANEIQIGGTHYQTGGLEHWDIVNIFQLDYFQGNITKYVFRHKKKNGIQDLKKAQHYLQKYIEILEDEQQKELNEQDNQIAKAMKVDATGGLPHDESRCLECGWVLGEHARWCPRSAGAR